MFKTPSHENICESDISLAAKLPIYHFHNLDTFVVDLCAEPIGREFVRAATFGRRWKERVRDGAS
jgi:hypothetical protein